VKTPGRFGAGTMETSKLYPNASQFKEVKKVNWSNRSALNCKWDIRLVFDDKYNFFCSKRDLTLMSPYFSVMFGGRFAEAHQTEVALHATDGRVLEDIIGYFYTHEVCITRARHSAQK
jgi:BTB/POZ domain